MSKQEQRFYVTQTIIRRNKTYGYNVIEARVYKLLDDGFPSLVHAFTYQTGAVPGLQNLVLRELISNGKVNSEVGKEYYEQEQVKIYEL
jgi:hypothetical protein